MDKNNYESYADVLESYMIAEESNFSQLLKDGWGLASKPQKAAVALGTAGVVAQLVALGIGGYKLIKRKLGKATPVGKDKEDKSKNKTYKDNTLWVIDKMKRDCPEIIEKELNLRKAELKKIIPILDRISKRVPSGFTIYSNVVKDYLNDPNSAIDTRYDDISDCSFFQNILPMASPKIFNTEYDKNCPEWCFKSYYSLPIGLFDIFDWLKDEKGMTSIDHDSVEEEEFWNVYVKFHEFLESSFSKFKCFQGIFGESDKGEGGYFEIVFKPSDEFIKAAKSYGWHE